MGEFSDFDEACMRRALQLAKQGEGAVEPNPMVGCVIAREEQILSEGWHHRFGTAHAEVDALSGLNGLAGLDGSAEASTAYVTLEPCCHQGKTPPCTQALISAGVRRVVVAMIDPNPQVAGQGVAQLRDAGVHVGVGLLGEEAVGLNRPFVCLMTKQRPWVIGKWAMSWDGRIATATGDSQWISNASSRRVVHQIRGRVDAIAVGSGTVRADDPTLTARPAGARVATRVVFDSAATLPVDSHLVRSVAEAPVAVIACPQASESAVTRLRQSGCEVHQFPGDQREQVLAAMHEFGERQMTNLLVEGGGELLSSFFAAGCIDEVHVFLGAKIIGGRDAMGPVAGHGIAKLADATQLADVQVELLDGDVYLRGCVS
jgi:diaminohydroxyphosphoribosylaminopyrimidine deaminase/5-amino-6-(5-phosphoribosylamino)uracil reductase